MAALEPDRATSVARIRGTLLTHRGEWSIPAVCLGRNVRNQRLTPPLAGYIAIALDPEERMKGANYILGAVVDGHVVARDDSGTGPSITTPRVEEPRT